MSKKLLEESTIRQFMKLAQLEPLAGDFLEEKRKMKRMEEGPMQKREEDATTPRKSTDVMGKKKEKAPKTNMPGDVEMKNEEIALEEELNALFEEDLNEMGDMYEGDMVYEEEDEDVEMEGGEAEINITPDQARAIIAVADMLKDIMPDLEAPEAEEEMDMEDEEEMDMDMDMDADAEADADVDAADDDLEDAAADEEEAGEAEEDAEEELAEAVMRRVKSRLREMKNK